MGQTLTLSAEDGHQLAAYRATPAGTPRGGLVVVQEIFGVNSHIKKMSDGWAADGYVALAPALFDRVERGVDMGYSPDDIQQGRELRGKISTDDSVRDVRAAVRELARAGLRVGVVGYCWGGTLAWLAAHGVAPESRASLARLAERRAALDQQVRVLAPFQRLFRYWHAFHLPLAVVMFLILVVHVAVAVAFGYVWVLG